MHKDINGRQLNPNLIKYTKELRQNSTNSENLLWHFLRNKQLNDYKFRRQHQIDKKYIVDFVCISEKLIVELDGSQHNDKAGIDHDNERTKFLNAKGYRILRVWNQELYENLEGVLETILYYLESGEAIQKELEFREQLDLPNPF